MSRAIRSRNFHVPLPSALYAKLRDESKRTGTPATELAREAIQLLLRRRERVQLHESIARYASTRGGGPADLDEDLERAGIESLQDDEGA